MTRVNKTGLLFVLPAVIVIIGIAVYPVSYDIILSCYKVHFEPKMHSVFVGAKNYKDLLSSPDFLSVIRRSILWAITNVIGSTVLGFVLSVLLIRIKFGRGIIMTLLFLPWVVPEVASAMIWKNLYHPAFGVLGVGKRIGLLGDPKTAFLAMSLVNIWKHQAFAMITLFAALKTFYRREIYEAANIDGTNSLQQLIYITIPLLKRAIFTVALLLFAWSIAQFTFPQVMTGGGPLDTTKLFSIYIYQATIAWRFGQAASASCVLFIIAFIPIIIYVLSRK